MRERKSWQRERELGRQRGTEILREKQREREIDRKEDLVTQTRTGQWAKCGGSATILPQHQPVRQK
jgi:hypothetical protein